MRCPAAATHGEACLHLADRCHSLGSLHLLPAALPSLLGLSPAVRVCAPCINKEQTPRWGVCSLLVPVAGLEPARCRQRWILSPLRLPFHHTGRCVMLFCFIGRCRLLRWPPAAADVAIVCGALRKHRPAKQARFLQTAALATPSLSLPLAALGLASVDFATSTIPSHRQGAYIV